jgi:osmotically-inducible protein OsmY
VATARPAERHHEIAAELAWLADTITFPCRLTARASGGMLEVRGQVPSPAAREQALRLARQASGLPVIDALEVKVLEPPPGPAPAQDVLRGVTHELLAVLGMRVQAVEVAARDGEITLSGVVATLEEKLAVASRLRRVPGCVCVVNLLRVAAPAPMTDQPVMPDDKGRLPAPQPPADRPVSVPAGKPADMPPASGKAPGKGETWVPVTAGEEEEAALPQGGAKSVIAVAGAPAPAPAPNARSGAQPAPLAP